MQELMDLAGLADGGAGTVALNGGIVASINGASEWVTDQLEHFGLHEKLARFYPFIPFAVAFVLGYLIDQDLHKALSNTLSYGTAAVTLHSIHRVTVKGE